MTVVWYIHVFVELLAAAAAFCVTCAYFAWVDEGARFVAGGGESTCYCSCC